MMANQNKEEQYFIQRLLLWNEKDNSRVMPWKQETDPYKIWLSEIILQQTRVQQGWDYYLKFLKNFPTISHLAKADDAKVFKLWEGLGYYNRCKNLLHTARYIHQQLNAVFPSTYSDILSLKGVGPYTAAAIASFAYQLPYAVVDGNVMRVLARYFGLHHPIDGLAEKKIYAHLAARLLPPKKAALYNQAIMDFGAVLCKPKLPLCISCPLQKKCIALKHNEVHLLPIKEKQPTREQRYFYYFFASYQHKVYLRKRTENDIWQNLFEPILIETKTNISAASLYKTKAFKNIFKVPFQVNKIAKPITQKLTHQQLYITISEITLQQPLSASEWTAVGRQKLIGYAFPKMLRNYLTHEAILKK